MIAHDHYPIAPTIPPQPPRRLILATAFLLALTVALAPRVPAVHAQETKPAPTAAKPHPAPKSVTIVVGTDSDTNTGAAPKDSPAAPDADADGKDATTDTTRKGGPGGPNIQIDKKGRVRVNGFGADRDFDSFDQFVHDEPTIAGMVIAIVSVVFLSPVLAIGLILWYRMRKQRMLNETMLKLAERGVVPAAEALNALAGGKSDALATASAAPLYEQAKQIRRRAAWSDLRKGVIMGGIGLGLVLYSVFDERSPNGLGLVLLFVGIGYVALWWFEERQLVSPSGITPAANATQGGSGGPPPLP